MLNKPKSKKSQPLSPGQKHLLRQSIKRLLGQGLIQESEKRSSETKAMVLKDALNAIVLNS
jgi:hypothetical protein